MDVIRVLLREQPEAWRRTLLVAGLAGVANAAILAIINRGAAIASNDTGLLHFRLLVLFGMCMLGFYLGKRYSLIQASVIVEHMLKNKLVRVCGKIRHSDLQVVENLGRGELYTKITQDTSLISQSGLILVNAAQQSFVLLFCLLYIAWLSAAAFAATLVVILVGIGIYFRHANSLQGLLKRLTDREAQLVDLLSHIIDGFKELRLNRKKNDAVFQKFVGVSEVVRDLKVDVQIGFCVDLMFSDVFFYLLLSVVVFLLPRLIPTYAAVVLMTTAAILFIIGPLQMVVQAAPVFERAKAALGNLQELENRLDQTASEPASQATDGGCCAHRNFQSIHIENALFSYGSNGSGTDFAVGPLNLRIERGETIFLVGGNGSGKTTALKLLTGLYLPQQGCVRLDRQVLDRRSIHGYRELFSAVFSQFHLFDALYGLEGVEEERVARVLDELQLTDKTRFENGRFTNLNLSTGQRKRLALAVCLLEDREIFIFDEWAADQDPHFRQHFYEVVLSRLKAEGKTVIAVTHDDRFWNLADRVIKMEYGRIVDDCRYR
ncbi:MAG TPA: cyclic peptide export ABC transporter [Bryobacteraceae bacterium]|nr:cyclic peptide export ABC transporter [Bryobacteraceae bacterium]